MAKKKEADIPISDTREIELASLGRGSLDVMFHNDMDAILDNIANPSMSPGVTRIYTIKLKIKPTDDRSAARVEIESTVKLASQKPIVTAFLLRTDGRRTIATESEEENQEELDFVETETEEEG